MREIKFRAMKTGGGKWIVGSLVSDRENGVAIIQQQSNPIFQGSATGWCFGVKPETVGQFTGLHDKNGKELYVGDIIKRWDDVLVIDDILNVGYMVGECTLIDGDFEILGNIHENPELL